MITLKGKYNTAQVYAKTVEMRCEDKIRQYLDHPAFADTDVRVMPDVHLGKSAVIGFTSTFGEAVIPSIIGTDIGCGVSAVNFGRGSLRFDKLDSFIRKNIPCGMEVRACIHEKLDFFHKTVSFLNEKGGNYDIRRFKSAIRALSDKQGHSPERIFASLGTLGGGNHFIEVDLDEAQNRWLIIHTGSRILGARTAEYFEIAALRETPPESPLKYLSGASLEEYCEDMAVVQFYARVNRALIVAAIADFFKADIEDGREYIESVHNYLDFDQRVIRKGAISANENEPLIIPFSMSEGSVIGRGKGNSEWNKSAPHGAGRKIPRSQARAGLSLDEYRKQMRKVWSSTVCKETLDESPMAYKKPKDILEFLDETVIVEKRLASVYNFKTVE